MRNGSYYREAIGACGSPRRQLQGQTDLKTVTRSEETQGRSGIPGQRGFNPRLPPGGHSGPKRTQLQTLFDDYKPGGHPSLREDREAAGDVTWSRDQHTSRRSSAGGHEAAAKRGDDEDDIDRATK